MLFKLLTPLKKSLFTGLLTVAIIVPFSLQAESEKAFAISVGSANLDWVDCPAFLGKGCKLAVLHGDPSKPNADVIFKTPGDFYLPKHWHSSAERMILISGELDLHYDGQKTLHAGPGMYIYGPAKLAHSGHCVSAVPCELFIAFEGPIDAHENH